MKELRREKLKSLLNSPRFGGDRNAFCRTAEISPGRLSQLLDPKEPFGDVAAKNLCDKLGLPEDFFTTDQTSILLPTRFGSPVSVLVEGEETGDGYVQIKESSIRFAAGNGRIPVFDELTDSVAATYRIDWFHKQRINPACCIRCKVHGDSMAPFLWDGETVLVNTAETNVVNGKVYALRYGEELRIKRVYRKLDGSFILHSDNPEFLPRDEDVPAAIAEEHIAIIGRVREKSGTGGL